ncbi:M23 family metallopeptidase [Thermoleophilia bacterium SCSIO 60948]|nr:M23 family metallopeptidase [Thermoleophilia bacterium SCSIO 60948]
MRIRPSRTRASLAALAASAGLAIIPMTAIADGGGVGTGGGGGGGKAEEDGVFPVEGKHSYGDGFGAGRGHQGVDILADCGQKVVASNDGIVRVVDRESSAGNYVVLKARGDKTDTVYMHLKDKADVREGDKVDAGQKLGKVGDTGNTTACHLHFEFWTEPGWYEGGEAKDPEKMLRKWDRQG